MQGLSSRKVFLLAVGFEGGLAVVAVGLGWIFDYWPLAQIVGTITVPHRLYEKVRWGVAATTPMLAAALVIERVRWKPFRNLRSLVTKLVVPVFDNVSVAALAVVSLFAGLGEELLFRGVLLDAPRQWWDGPFIESLALVASSILFGLVHPFSRTYVVLATLIGAYLGLLLIITDSLLPPIIAHALYDFIILTYVLRTAGRA